MVLFIGTQAFTDPFILGGNDPGSCPTVGVSMDSDDKYGPGTKESVILVSGKTKSNTLISGEDDATCSPDFVPFFEVWDVSG